MSDIAEVRDTETAIAAYGVGGMPESFNNKMIMAKALCASGLMPNGMNTPEKVCVALQWGYELGLSPMVAVNNIAVINGKPTLSADMLHAIARRSPEYGGCKWIVQDDKKAECIIYRKTAAYTEEVKGLYTIEMAQAAGLMSKDNWKKYPQRMLKHRALSYALRDAFPDLLAGFYTPEEMTGVKDTEPRNITPPEEKQPEKVKKVAPTNKTTAPQNIAQQAVADVTDIF